MTGISRRAALGISGRTVLTGSFLAARALAGFASSEEDLAGTMIDTHIHVVPSGIEGIKPKPKDVEKLYEGPPSDIAARVKVEMELAGFRVAFGMGSLNSRKDDPLGIAGILELSRSVPGLKAVGVANPKLNQPDHMKAVEAQIDANRDKIVALKAYLGYLHFGPEHSAYRPYYELASKYDLPVIVHTGDNWSTKAKVKYAHPLRMDEVAVDHDKVRFVLAHFGNPWLMDAAEVVFKNPNVYAELSGLFVGSDREIHDLLSAARMPDSAPGLAISDLRKAIYYVGDSTKFLYGSDWPLAPMGSYRRLIESIIPKEHHRQVFRTNAERVFRLRTG
jgi:predicted TIM-barrel fold metal-dependent hydrolase